MPAYLSSVLNFIQFQCLEMVNIKVSCKVRVLMRLYQVVNFNVHDCIKYKKRRYGKNLQFKEFFPARVSRSEPGYTSNCFFL